MPAARPTYTAKFERDDDGAWMAALVEEPNVHGYGETLVAARRNIRDAIITLFGPFEAGADGYELVEEVRLPEAVLAVVRAARVQRDQAYQQRAEARAAEEAAAGETSRAIAATKEAARLLVAHGGLMIREVDNVGLVEDVRLPEAVVSAVERAHVERQAARRQHDTARAAEDALDQTSREAVATNRQAARLLVECGLTTEEAAGVLGLSPQRAERLLTD